MLQVRLCVDVVITITITNDLFKKSRNNSLNGNSSSVKENACILVTEVTHISSATSSVLKLLYDPVLYGRSSLILP